MRIFSFFLFLSIAQTSQAEGTGNSYQLGRGYAIGETGWRLGGYTSARIGLPKQAPWHFEISDVSLFLSWDNGDRLKFFSELEVGDPLSAGEHQSLTGDNAHFEFERFYLDGLITNNLTLRAGKFLTPIGQWNRIHAYPLVWTTFRPVATENLFSTHATGLMLHGQLPLAGRSLEYALFGDLSHDIDPHLSNSPFKDAAGAYLRYSVTDNLQIGTSFANYVLHEFQDDRYYLAGMDFAWRYQKFELTGEMVYRTGIHGNTRDRWQGFVQSVNPLTDRWFVIGRYEFFQQWEDHTGEVGVFGLAFRPVPPVIWKLEYRLGSHNELLAPDGMAASFSVLF